MDDKRWDVDQINNHAIPPFVSRLDDAMLTFWLLSAAKLHWAAIDREEAAALIDFIAEIVHELEREQAANIALRTETERLKRRLHALTHGTIGTELSLQTARRIAEGDLQELEY